MMSLLRELSNWAVEDCVRRHRSAGRALAFILLLHAMSAAPGLAAPTGVASEIFDLPRVNGLTIDGNDADWGYQGLSLGVMLDERGRFQAPADFDPQLRLAWDERGLLVLAHVSDDEPKEHSYIRRMFLGDSLELFVSSGRGIHDYFMLLIGPGVDPTQPSCRHIFFDQRSGGVVGPEELPELAVQIARQATPDGYRVELLLPWENLRLDPRLGRTVAFQAYAMDQDSGEETFRVAWYPAFDTHENNTNSMHLLRLSDRAHAPVEALMAVHGNRVAVVATERHAGRHVELHQENEFVDQAVLVTQAGRATATLQLPPFDAARRPGDLVVHLDGSPIGRVERASVQQVLSQAMEEASLTFWQHVFSGTNFPRVEFRNQEAVRALAGEVRVQARFFNSHFDEVATATEPGRYGAVVEVTFEGGPRTRRFFTLYRTLDDQSAPLRSFPPWAVPDLGAVELADGSILQGSASHAIGSELSEAEARRLAAALEEQAAAPVSDEVVEIADNRWWIGLKRRLYGMDSAPVAPAPNQLTESVGTLREGSPQDAGLPAQVTDELEELFQEWRRSNAGLGLSVCVAHNGVVFFERAYGVASDGTPMTVTTRDNLGSITKMFAGVIFMMFVQDGFLSLDRPVGAAIPPLQSADSAMPITHRMLFTHTSGMSGHYGEDLRDLEERVAEFFPQLQPPVTHLYSSLGVEINTRAMELLSGEPFAVLCKKLLLNPLKLDSTTVPYSWDGAYSTSRDLVTFGQMLASGGAYGDQQILMPDALDQLKPRQLSMILGDDTPKRWGIGFWGVLREQDRINRDVLVHPSENSTALYINTRTNTVAAILCTEEEGRSFYNEKFDRFIRIISGDIHESSANSNP